MSASILSKGGPCKGPYYLSPYLPFYMSALRLINTDTRDARRVFFSTRICHRHMFLPILITRFVCLSFFSFALSCLAWSCFVLPWDALPCLVLVWRGYVLGFFLLFFLAGSLCVFPAKNCYRHLTSCSIVWINVACLFVCLLLRSFVHLLIWSACLLALICLL